MYQKLIFTFGWLAAYPTLVPLLLPLFVELPPQAITRSPDIATTATAPRLRRNELT
jgi:hypothetical protein